MAKIILCRGIQGSGKTTWAKQYCKGHPNTIRVIGMILDRCLAKNGLRNWSK